MQATSIKFVQETRKEEVHPQVMDLHRGDARASDISTHCTHVKMHIQSLNQHCSAAQKFSHNAQNNVTASLKTRTCSSAPNGGAVTPPAAPLCVKVQQGSGTQSIRKTPYQPTSYALAYKTDRW